MKSKLIFASDSFKGTLSSLRAGELLTRAAREVFGDKYETVIVPVADGGEGTAEAVVYAAGGKRVPVRVTGPLGEQVAAFVIKEPGSDLTEEDIFDYCKGQIAWYKSPKFVQFVDEFPMNAAGKIKKFVLREMAHEIWPDA